MLSFLLRPRVLVAAMALALPFAGGGGCGGRTACFAFSSAQFMQQNSCPAQADALPNFTDPHCPGGIVSVDSDGSFDGELCCYSVTYNDIVPDCGTGAGGAGTGTVTPGVSAVGVATGVTVSSSGPPMCAPSCNQALTTGSSPCGMGSPFFAKLQVCAQCNGVSPSDGGPSCDMVCLPFCLMNAPPFVNGCISCLQSSCSQELTDCLNN
jgi:hypothetical protein